MERSLKTVTLKAQNTWKKKVLEHEEQILNLTDSLKKSTDALSKVNDEVAKLKHEKTQLTTTVKRQTQESEDAAARHEAEIKKLVKKGKERKEMHTEAEKQMLM